MRKLIQRGTLLGILMLSTLSIGGSFAGQENNNLHCAIRCDLEAKKCWAICYVIAP